MQQGWNWLFEKAKCFIIAIEWIWNVGTTLFWMMINPIQTPKFKAFATAGTFFSREILCSSCFAKHHHEPLVLNWIFPKWHLGSVWNQDFLRKKWCPMRFTLSLDYFPNPMDIPLGKAAQDFHINFNGAKGWWFLRVKSFEWISGNLANKDLGKNYNVIRKMNSSKYYSFSIGGNIIKRMTI